MNRTIDIQGHRGARGLFPENTLVGFQRAIELGVSTLELDVGISQDGIVVISHDPALNPELARRSDASYLVAPILLRQLTLSQIKDYDVGRLKPGSICAQRFPDQQACDGATIPALSALFKWVKKSGADQVCFNIETKIFPDRPNDTVPPQIFARKLMDVVRQHGMQSRVTVQSFDWRTLAAVRAMQKGQAKRVRLSCLSSEQPQHNTISPVSPSAPSWTAGVRRSDHAHVPSMVKAIGGDIWSPHFADLNPATIQAAHRLGLQVIPWTPNTFEDMAMCIDAGADGLITDYPDRAVALAASRAWVIRACQHS